MNSHPLNHNLRIAALIVAYTILAIGCTNKENEAKKLGFENAAEMEEINSKGYKTKKEYEEAKEKELEEYRNNQSIAWKKGFTDPDEMKDAAKLNIHDGTEYILTMARAQRRETIEQIRQRKNQNELEQVLDPFTSTARKFEGFKRNGGLNNNSEFYGIKIQRISYSYTEEGDFDYAILKSPRLDFNDSSFDFAIFALAHACEISDTEFIQNKDDSYANAFAVNKNVKCSINSSRNAESMDLMIKRNKGQIKIKELPTEKLKLFTGTWAKYKNECPKNDAKEFLPQNHIITYDEERKEYLLSTLRADEQHCLITGRRQIIEDGESSEENHNTWLNLACRRPGVYFFKKVSFNQIQIPPNFEYSADNIVLDGEAVTRCPRR